MKQDIRDYIERLNSNWSGNNPSVIITQVPTSNVIPVNNETSVIPVTYDTTNKPIC